MVNRFHADNGSEYANHQVTHLLHKLHVGEFTKSRPRRSNDNALVEGKNGSVVRRHLGHGHIPRHFAGAVNAFTQNVLSPFPDYHRPCHFPVETVGDDGRVTRRYPYANVATPHEKFKSLDAAAQYLRPGVTIEQLMPSPAPPRTSTPRAPPTRRATDCSAPSRPRPRRDGARIATEQRRGPDPTPRFPPPAHRRFTVCGGRARAWPVENAPRTRPAASGNRRRLRVPPDNRHSLDQRPAPERPRASEAPPFRLVC